MRLHWYIVCTKPREERRASEHLHNQGFEVFLPFTWGRRRRAGHHAAAVVPFFRDTYFYVPTRLYSR